MICITESRTSRGGRGVNEDAHDHQRYDADRECWVVADGLGGHRGGELASRCAVETILASFGRSPQLNPATMSQHITLAHEAIVAAQNSGPPEMRSTAAVLARDGREVMWAHVGDSRVYYFRRGEIIEQTADHSVPQLLVTQKEITLAQIRSHPDRSRLLKALGQESPPRVTVSSGTRTLRPGDVFLLCTDGWWEHVREPEMEMDLRKASTPGEWLQCMIDRVLTATEVRRILGEPIDAYDNFTAIGIFVST